MNTLLQEHSEKSDSRGEEGLTDSFIHRVKDVSIEDKIGKSYSMEEKSGNYSTNISFSSEPSDLSALDKDNCKDSSINVGSQESSIGKISLESPGAENKCNVKDVTTNNNFENQSLVTHPKQDDSKETVSSECAQIDSSVEHKSSQSFHSKTAMKPLNTKEETISNKPLEICMSEEMSTSGSFQHVNKNDVSPEINRDIPHSSLEEDVTKSVEGAGVTDNSKNQRNLVQGKRNGSKRSRNNHKKHLEKKIMNSSSQQCAQKQTTLQDMSFQEHACKVISLNDPPIEKIASSDCLHDKMKSTHTQENRAKSDFLGISNIPYEKQRYFYHNKNRMAPWAIQNYKNIGTKEKSSFPKFLSKDGTFPYTNTSKDCPVVSSEVSAKQKETCYDHFKLGEIATNFHPSDKMSRQSIGKSIAFTTVKSFADRTSQEAFILKSRSLEEYAKASHSVMGRNDTKKSLIAPGLHMFQESWPSGQNLFGNEYSMSRSAFEFRHTVESFRMQNSEGVLNPYKSSRGWSSAHDSFSGNGCATKTFRNHSAQHSLSQMDYPEHPYRGGYQELGLPPEYFKVKMKNTSGDKIDSGNIMPKVVSEESQSSLHTASINNNIATVIPYNSSNLAHANTVNSEKKNLETKCAPSFNDQVMPSNCNAKSPWISFHDLSVLLSTFINIYLQSFAKENVIKLVFSTLHSIVELVEETMKGYGMNLRIISAISQNAFRTYLPMMSTKKLHGIVGIVLLQRKRVTESMEILQEELKSINWCGSYSEREVSEICNGIRRKVLKLIEILQWLNDDVKFDCYLVQVTHSSPYLECEESMNILQDLETTKEYLKSQIKSISSVHNYCRTDSKFVTENATFNTLLVKQCFIIKQRLEDLNICLAKD